MSLSVNLAILLLYSRAWYNTRVGKKIIAWRPFDREVPLPNAVEASFEELARRNGWRTTKQGWPDFLCIKDDTGEAIAVEVKPRDRFGRLQPLSPSQVACMLFLRQHGIRCFVSDGKALEKFDLAKHARRYPLGECRKVRLKQIYARIKTPRSRRRPT